MESKRNRLAKALREVLAAWQVVTTLAIVLCVLRIYGPLNWNLRFLVISSIAIPFGIGYSIYLRSLPWTGNSRPGYFSLFYRKALQRGLLPWIRQVRDAVTWSIGYRVRAFRNSSVAPTSDSIELCKSKQSTLERKCTIIIEDDAAGMIGDVRVPILFVSPTKSRDELLEISKLFFDKVLRAKKGVVITNSRMLEPEDSYNLYQKIAFALEHIADLRDVEIRWFIRTDSCLRTHVFKESIAVRDGRRETGKQEEFDYYILSPAFISEGRVTRDGVQYFEKNDGQKNPIHQTIHGQFRAHEYRTSNLAVWLEHKSSAKISRKKVELVNVDKLRSRSSRDLAKELVKLERKTWIVFDSISQTDVYSVAAVILDMEMLKSKVLIRGSTSLANAFLTSDPQKNIGQGNASNFAQGNPGFIIAGSLTPRSKKQIRNCEDMHEVTLLQFEIEDLDDPKALGTLIKRKTGKISNRLKEGKSVILTTKEWFDGEYVEYPNSEIRRKVLNVFADVLQSLTFLPSWIMFKGSDTAFHCICQGLDIRFSEFIGKPTPCTFECVVLKSNAVEDPPRIILFAGNVGTEDELAEFVKLVHQAADTTAEPTSVQSILDNQDQQRIQRLYIVFEQAGIKIEDKEKKHIEQLFLRSMNRIKEGSGRISFRAAYFYRDILNPLLRSLNGEILTWDAIFLKLSNNINNLAVHWADFGEPNAAAVSADALRKAYKRKSDVKESLETWNRQLV